MFGQLLLQIYHVWDNHKRLQTFFSSLAGLKNVHFVVCLPKNKFVRDDKLLYTK